MFLPLDMCPARHVPAQELETTLFCPCCRKPFVCSTGVVHQTYYKRGGEIRYGKVLICTLKCLLLNFNAEGNA